MNIKSQIVGLIEIKERRGLQGPAPREVWMMESLAILLRAELERQEKEKNDRN